MTTDTDTTAAPDASTPAEGKKTRKPRVSLPKDKQAAYHGWFIKAASDKDIRALCEGMTLEELTKHLEKVLDIPEISIHTVQRSRYSLCWERVPTRTPQPEAPPEPEEPVRMELPTQEWFKELKAQVDPLKKKVEDQSTEIAQLKSKVAELEREVKALKPNTLGGS